MAYVIDLDHLCGASSVGCLRRRRRRHTCVLSVGRSEVGISVKGVGFGSAAVKRVQIASAAGVVGSPQGAASVAASVMETLWSRPVIVIGQPREVAASQAITFMNKSFMPATVKFRRSL